MLERALLTTIALVAIISTSTFPVAAQPAKQKRIAIGGLSQLDDATTSSKLIAELERAITASDLGEVIGLAEVRKRVTAVNRPQLLNCEGARRCLAKMGTVVGAEWVLAAEAGGLGNVQVVHLKLIEAKTSTILRSVTATIAGSNRPTVEPGALVKLLAPKRYIGTLVLEGAIDEAEIIIDGKPRGQVDSRKNTSLGLSVGTHALRVTHPSHSDHVSFVEVSFGETIKRRLAMKPLAIARNTLEREQGPLGQRPEGSTAASRPWYARWYVVAAVGAVVLGGSIAIWTRRSDVDADGSGNIP